MERNKKGGAEHATKNTNHIFPQSGGHCQLIIAYIREHGSITSVQAFKEMGCTRLSARIKELRDHGYKITTEMRKTKEGKVYGVYREEKDV